MKSYQLILHTPDQQLILQVPEHTSVRLALDMTGVRVRAACGGIATCGACTIKALEGDFSPLTLAEYQKIPIEQREQGMRLACQLYLHSDAEVFLENPAPDSNWKSLDLSTWPEYEYPKADLNNTYYAVAVDLGTTHIRLSFWDKQQQKRIASRHGNNPQVALGEDVLTRLDVHRQRSEGLQSLTDIVRQAIILGVKDILARDIGEIKSILDKVGLVSIVGNTAMLALVSGQDGSQLYKPENWENQIVCLPDDLTFWKQAWRMPNAEIKVQPPLAGFLGSDILADLIAVDITQYRQPVMLADFGTNTEIALWDGQQIWLTSVPGGPAFEGVGLENGLGAEQGAIRGVSLTDNAYILDVIGKKTAKGFCASGFVDAIALLRQQEILKVSGRFASPDNNKGYQLQAGNDETVVKAVDIDAFQRAKAATAAAMQHLLVLAEIPNHNLTKLWICGAFGQHLNVPHAISLGLLPTMGCTRIELFANAALSGCEKMILNSQYEQQISDLRRLVKVINVAKYPEYDDFFINHLRLKAFMEKTDV